ncbi:unnamed protein product [Soboliphyme baturini]|uniref:Peptidase S1 domain-containing protein n=1 Tax=Soboliphyme baturini TaxID=241478 RepID=A0A183J938_9BILA|nr:unnamed protein product [Soboliphyme baturini]
MFALIILIASTKLLAYQVMAMECGVPLVQPTPRKSVKAVGKGMTPWMGKVIMDDADEGPTVTLVRHPKKLNYIRTIAVTSYLAASDMMKRIENDVSRLRVHFDLYDVKDAVEGAPNTYSVKAVILESQASSDDALLHFAVVVLNEEVDATPLCFPYPSSIVDFSSASTCFMSGYENLGGKSGFDLRYKKLAVKDPSNCPIDVDPKTEICTDNYRCKADDGSPFQCKIGDKWYIAGIRDRGIACNAFVNVSSSENFIMKNMFSL